MAKAIKIGDKIYKCKKDALDHYRRILNSYDFGQSLNDDDFDDLLDLIEYNNSFFDKEGEQSEDEQVWETGTVEYEDEQVEQIEEELEIADIIVSKVQFNTKCFEVIWSDSSTWYISYRLMINRHKVNHSQSFNVACRNAVQKDLINLKQQYFRDHAVNAHVKCQETGKLSKWDDLVIDHRQPNTFSVIIDRFKEVNQINIDEIKYTVNEANLLMFESENLTEKFRIYHSQKANLRIVGKDVNLSRTGMARLKRNSKDLAIKQLSLNWGKDGTIV